MKKVLVSSVLITAIGVAAGCSSSSSSTGNGGDDSGSDATSSGASGSGGSGSSGASSSGSSSSGASSGASGSSSGGADGGDASSSSSGGGSSGGSSGGTDGGAESGSSSGGTDGSAESGSSSGAGSEGGPGDGGPVPDSSFYDGPVGDGGPGTDATFYEGGPSDGGPTDAAADVSPLCDPVSLTSAPTVTATTVGTAFPTGGNTGGTLVSGTYYWTSETVYSNGTADSNTKAAVVIDTANMTLRVTNSQNSSAETYTTANGSSGWAIQGTSLCGGSGGPTILYSVSGSVDAGTFAITTYDSAHARVETFTLQ